MARTLIRYVYLKKMSWIVLCNPCGLLGKYYVHGKLPLLSELRISHFSLRDPSNSDLCSDGQCRKCISRISSPGDIERYVDFPEKKINLTEEEKRGMLFLPCVCKVKRGNIFNMATKNNFLCE